MNAEAPPPRVRWRELAVALLAAWLFRAGSALVLSLAPASAVAASGIRNLATGDAALFARGGMYLIEVLTDELDLFAELLFPSLVLLLVLAFASILPEWTALRAFGAPAAPANRSLPRLGAIGILTWGLRALLAFTTAALALTLRSYFVGATDERLPTMAVAVVALLGLALQACISVWHDLTEIHIVANDATPRDAVADAFTALRERGFGLAARYLGSLLASAAVVAAATAVVSLIDVSQGGTVRPLLAAVIHQVAVVGTLVVRTGWLWCAWTATRSARPPGAFAELPLDAR